MNLQKKYLTPVFVVVFLIVILLSLFVLNFPYYKEISSLNHSVCPVGYSRIGELSGGGSIVVFYNKNNMTINNLKLELYEADRKEGYDIVGSLEFNSSAHKIFNEKVSSEDLSLKWCCDGKCYKMDFNKAEAKNIEIRNMEGLSDNITSPFRNRTYNESETAESYPPHPQSQDCKVIDEDYKRGFCYVDVAEITGEIKYCERIEGPEIKIFCKARAKLDEKMCEYIRDDKLRSDCIRSINRKEKWLGKE